MQIGTYKSEKTRREIQNKKEVGKYTAEKYNSGNATRIIKSRKANSENTKREIHTSGNNTQKLKKYKKQKQEIP